MINSGWILRKSKLTCCKMRQKVFSFNSVFNSIRCSNPPLSVEECCSMIWFFFFFSHSNVNCYLVSLSLIFLISGEHNFQVWDVRLIMDRNSRWFKTIQGSWLCFIFLEYILVEIVLQFTYIQRYIHKHNQ